MFDNLPDLERAIDSQGNPINQNPDNIHGLQEEHVSVSSDGEKKSAGSKDGTE